ncbi:MAG: sulfatase-like hydrolase/transferase [Bryobacteraceae bacterium]|nr:sulfatase-like hydrolase/transferase [Bryobacteraceae bacterium]
MLTRRQVLSSLAAAPLLRAAQKTRPNIVLLFADDLGYGDLSSYGAAEIRTPNIDSLASRGVRFSRFYSNAPECTPSRTALLTGRYQQRVGGLECAIGVGNVGRYDEAVWLRERGELGLPASEPTIAPALKRQGYDTAIIGKWHLGYEEKFWPHHHGFDESFCVQGGGIDYFRHTEPGGLETLIHNGRRVKAKGYFTDVIADRSVEWLRARGRNPYFLYLPFTAPHTPLQGPGDGPRPIGQDWNEGRSFATYRAMIEHMDKRIGDVLKTVDARGDAENTIVIFLSDNGAARPGSNGGLRGFKGQLWEGGIRVPCLLRWPARFARAEENAAPTLNFDLTATLLEAAGVHPFPLDGRSIFPEQKERTLFWRYKRLENRRKAVLEGELKYVSENGEPHLFDLRADPREENNLVKTRPQDVKRLERKLAEWEKEVEAPRLRPRLSGD